MFQVAGVGKADEIVLGSCVAIPINWNGVPRLLSRPTRLGPARSILTRNIFLIWALMLTPITWQDLDADPRIPMAFQLIPLIFYYTRVLFFILGPLFIFASPWSILGSFGRNKPIILSLPTRLRGRTSHRRSRTTLLWSHLQPFERTLSANSRSPHQETNTKSSR